MSNPTQSLPGTQPAAPARRPFPREPKTWEELGIEMAVVEQIIMRLLLQRVADTARAIATELCIAPPLVKEVLEMLRNLKQPLTQHRGTNSMGDFIYELSEAGRNRAAEYKRNCAYVGPVPVPWEAYLKSVRGQSLTLRAPGPEDLVRAFSDLSVSPGMLARLGPAITSGKAMFLFGDPGNGKTSFAERITRCFGDTIWLPNTLYVDGHIVKLFDPMVHEPVEFSPPNPQDKVDTRWQHIKRPTIIAGGELSLEMLELQPDHVSNINEPSMQLKANGGTLVIDDFGRGRTSPKELLNRWIFPLEKRNDFLKLPDGRKITVPFDCLLVFSTNLQPRDLADEAFLRRIPYKIKVLDPNEKEFRDLVDLLAQKMRVELPAGSVDYLISTHYKLPTGQRPFRFCHPRDLLQQIVHMCTFERRPARATPLEWDRVIANYFGA
jgi:predicted ATPase with chaperone activity